MAADTATVQGQTHRNATTGTMRFCHTSCDLLDAGSVEDLFRTLVGWLDANPYEVVTILMGNDDVVNVEEYVAPILNSGLKRFVYVPPSVPMDINGWPTLGEMIISGKRVVVFLDYEADQSRVPYILDEFQYIWETPFSPTDTAFPCTLQRPPNLPRDVALRRMSIANHNLNVAISLLGQDLLIPNTALINQTNNVSGDGSLGQMTRDCESESRSCIVCCFGAGFLLTHTDRWDGRPPNFLLVDYYNLGYTPGTVFQVAAEANNVTYNRPCCGLNNRSGAPEALSQLKSLLTLTGLSIFALLLT